MAKTKKQLANALISQYSKLYQQKFASKPSFSRYAVMWGMLDTLEDYSYEEISSLLEYFFSLSRKSYKIENFYSNVHKMLESQEESERRRAERDKILEQTKRAVEEFEQHRG